MLEFLKNIFASDSFIPHGHCYLWKSELVWLHIMSDFLIAIAYYSIPITLVYFVRKRQDLPFNWIFLLFGTFIIACGTTHLIEIWTLWHPTYWLAGFVKSITAIVSVYTALELVPLVPQALALPSPAQLEATNRELLEQISKRELAEAALQTANKKLEIRVKERTTELRNANQKLQTEIVERKQVEVELRNALQKLSFHVQNSPLAVVEWNHEFRLQHWSHKAEQMFGWKAEEVLNRAWQDWQFVFEEDLESVNSHTAGLVDGSKPSLVCYNRNYTKDGSVIDCEWYNSSLLDESGNLVSVLSLIQDVSDRKRAESALAESYSILRAVLEGTTDSIFMKDTQGRYLTINSAGAQVIGKPVEDIVGKNDLEIFPANIALPIMENDRKLMTAGLNQAYEDVVPVNGQLRTFLSTKAVYRNAQGNVMGLIGIARDISDRKRNEEALRRSEEFLQRMFASSADCIKVMDLDGRLLSMNTGGQFLMEIDDFAPLVKSSWFDFWLSADQHSIYTAVEVAKAGGIGTFQAYCPTAKGTPKWWDVVITPIMDASGKPEQLLSVSRDITERKLAEQQIKEINQDLERRVAQRTTELQATNKELEAFSYSVSHDLRAPLRSIDGFSLALLERYSEQLDDKGKHYLQRVRAGSQRMGELIDDLLKLSRVTRAQIQCQKIDLTAMVEAIAADLQQNQPQRAVDFVIAPGVVAAGDEQLLRVMLENLLNNAWKFTSNQVSARIEFGITEQNFSPAYFIKDNGAGFDMAYSDKLFGAFQRLHTADEFPGTGIGLATVQRIIHRHGGHIWAEGAVEQGATFYFTLEHQLNAI